MPHVRNSVVRTVLFIFGLGASAQASPEQVARITNIAGPVQIFTHPSKTPHMKKKVRDSREVRREEGVLPLKGVQSTGDMAKQIQKKFAPSPRLENTPASSTLDESSQSGGAQGNSHDGSMALFEGEYFIVKDAAPGDSVENGNIVRTLPGARARLVYPNGDQIMVGPGSAYRVSWDKKEAGRAQIEMMYGKVRSVVSKGGPRSRFSIRTKAATMGVRGTDFFIEEDPLSGQTLLTVIRGSVEIQSRESGSAPPVEVKTGQSAIAATSEAKDAEVAKKVEVRATSKEEYAEVTSVSTLAQAEKGTVVAPKNPAIAAELKQLEQKAVQTTLKDIQTHQPELYAKLSPALPKVPSVEQIHAQAVEALAVQAPSIPRARKKPTRKELDSGLEADPYEKYFKLGN